jgi:NAD(P)-dependent dehydrogenase (short-subunit alcohol dehydrogenase family)
MKTALITGANRGIGLEMTRQYAADGWRVIACSRHPQSSNALAELAARHPQQIEIHALDVADAAQIAQLARALNHTAIDLLLNNAGIYPEADARGFGHTDYTEWARAFDINTMAPLRMAEAFAAHLARGDLKILATLSSKMGSVADNDSGGSYLYRASKAATNMVVKSLSIDLKRNGIIAVVLHPGWVQTDMGGVNALIPVERSVSGLRGVMARLTLADSGKFFDFEGEEIPW